MKIYSKGHFRLSPAWVFDFFTPILLIRVTWKNLPTYLFGAWTWVCSINALWLGVAGVLIDSWLSRKMTVFILICHPHMAKTTLGIKIAHFYITIKNKNFVTLTVPSEISGVYRLVLKTFIANAKQKAKKFAKVKIDMNTWNTKSLIRFLQSFLCIRNMPYQLIFPLPKDDFLMILQWRILDRYLYDFTRFKEKK